jgi:methylmalonyl-CoA/ethylmalonyl-CoA epimerase
VIKRLGHVGVVVEDLDEALELYERVLGLKARAIRDAADGKHLVAFIPVGDGEIDLIQPVAQDTSFGEFLKTHGQGIHHIALVADNIDTETDRMKTEGIAFNAQKPRVGAHGVRIIFTKPETTGGITYELFTEH